jgi:catechol 2,3-dioxygenase-like lactoylglutathione lyase family enzyme
VHERIQHPAVVFRAALRVEEHADQQLSRLDDRSLAVVPDREAVREFCEAARALGGTVLHEPRVWPEYHEHYYGAFVRDPDGNNVEAVCHLPG